jgi:hypothetical protein
MNQVCFEWPQRGVKNHKDIMIIPPPFCASCAFLWLFISSVAAAPPQVKTDLLNFLFDGRSKPYSKILI